MFRRHYNLVLMVFWLAIAWLLLAPDWGVPEKLRGKFGGLEGLLVGLLALTLAAYNAVRWWSLQLLYRNRAAVRVNPLAVRHRDPEPYEPNPELDFLKVPDADNPPPEPSANGDKK